MNKLKLLDSSVSVPPKTQVTPQESLWERKCALTFTEDRYNVVQRRINDIRFDDSRFWMEVNIVSHSQGPLVNYWDKSTKKSHETNKGGVPYFNMQFVATDDDFGASTIKLYLSSHDGQGEGFLGSAADASKNDKKAREMLRRLTDQRTSVQVLVESVQSGPNSSDKIFRIVGTYTSA